MAAPPVEAPPVAQELPPQQAGAVVATEEAFRVMGPHSNLLDLLADEEALKRSDATKRKGLFGPSQLPDPKLQKTGPSEAEQRRAQPPPVQEPPQAKPPSRRRQLLDLIEDIQTENEPARIAKRERRDRQEAARRKQKRRRARALAEPAGMAPPVPQHKPNRSLPPIVFAEAAVEAAAVPCAPGSSMQHCGLLPAGVRVRGKIEQQGTPGSRRRGKLLFDAARRSHRRVLEVQRKGLPPPD